MWFQDCHLSVRELLELRERMEGLSDDLQALSEDIAESEALTPFHQPGPFCGYVSQARNALGLSAAAVNEVLAARSRAAAADALGGPPEPSATAADADLAAYLGNPEPEAYAASPNRPPVDAGQKVTPHLA